MRIQTAASFREALREDCMPYRSAIAEAAWPGRSKAYAENKLGRFLNGVQGQAFFEAIEHALALWGERSAVAAYINHRAGLRVERRVHGADSVAVVEIERMQRQLVLLRAEIGHREKARPIRVGDVPEQVALSARGGSARGAPAR